jgi:hypothetical protein
LRLNYLKRILENNYIHHLNSIEMSTTTVSAPVKDKKASKKASDPNYHLDAKTGKYKLNSGLKSETKIKKPLTSFLLFSEEQRPIQGQGMKQSEYSKLLQPQWKNMSAENKQKYIDKAAVLKAKYTDAVAALSATGVNLKSIVSKPVTERAPGSYAYFTKVQTPLLKAEYPDFPSRSKKIGELWRGLSAADRAKIEAEAALQPKKAPKVKKIRAPRKSKTAVAVAPVMAVQIPAPVLATVVAEPTPKVKKPRAPRKKKDAITASA